MKAPILERNKRRVFQAETRVVPGDEPIPEVQPYPIDFVHRRTRLRVKRERIVIDWFIECQEKVGVDVAWLGEEKAANWEYAAKKLLKDYGMDDVLSCITWMTGPHCKYHQCPFGLRLVKETIEEFLDLRRKGLLELKHFRGLLGELVNVREAEC